MFRDSLDDVGTISKNSVEHDLGSFWNFSSWSSSFSRLDVNGLDSLLSWSTFLLVFFCWSLVEFLLNRVLLLLISMGYLLHNSIFHFLQLLNSICECLVDHSRGILNGFLDCRVLGLLGLNFVDWLILSVLGERDQILSRQQDSDVFCRTHRKNSWFLRVKEMFQKVSEHLKRIVRNGGEERGREKI
ncbi:Protein CBG25489 [Caenorhabditis briggsae]|uniref:Protein CBG25489 n=1 Tax=Caenorhabditis briggsae TaxID=6238 RepID=B6IIW4_CAEBR|nr:Protein CBG25489 [Caenorhabditis briggsae]CAR99844.1 Protein CBG25489 [Caenorhabditis briggsae]